MGRVTVIGTCATCRYFTPLRDEPPPLDAYAAAGFGSCSNYYTVYMATGFGPLLERNCAVIVQHDGPGLGEYLVGPEYGCVRHEPRQELIAGPRLLSHIP